MVGDTVFVAGGQDAGAELLASVEQYRPDQDRWFPCPALPRARKGCACAAVAGRLLCLGGRVGRDDTDLICSN